MTERKKAARKQEKISKLLIGGSTPGPEEESGGILSEAAPAGHGRTGSSLYDDTFSRRKERFPWTLVVLGSLAVVALILALGFLLSGNERTMLVQIPVPPEQTADGGTPGTPEAPQESPPAQSGGTTESLGSPPKTTDVTPAPPRSPTSTPETTTTADRAGPSGASSSPPVRKQDHPVPASGPAAPPVQSPAKVPPSDESVMAGSQPTETSGPPVEEKAAEATDTLPEEPPSTEPVEKPGEAVYQLLLQNSEVAAKLIAGSYETLEFRDWRVVQQTPKETWIDLIAVWKDTTEEVHFIWSVSPESGAVRALSQAARNLDSGGELSR